MVGCDVHAHIGRMERPRRRDPLRRPVGDLRPASPTATP